MKLTRRNFLKLGAASSSLIYLESKFSILSSLGEELTKGGKDYSLAGKERKVVPGTCLMCGVTDGILGYVEDGRLVKIEGNPKHPNTRGRICAKSQSGIQYLYDPYRIKYPMLRVGERGEKKWKRISREEALDMVADKIKEAVKKGEPGRVAVHKGRERDNHVRKRFLKAVGTEHDFNHTSICEVSMKVGYETTWGTDFSVPDIERGIKYGVLLGENVYECSYMMVPMAQRYAKAQIDGMKLVVFDPRLSNTAAKADEWHALRPGTDGAVLLAMANVIANSDYPAKAKVKKFFKEWANYPFDKFAKYLTKFTPKWAEEISSVPAADIERVAKELAAAAPHSFVRNYNGLSNNVNGAMNARIVATLNGLLGNIDEEGGLNRTIGGKTKEPEPKPPTPEGEFPFKEWMEESYPLSSEEAWHLLPVIAEEVKYKLDVYIIHMYNPLFTNPDVKKWRELLYDKEKVGFIVDFSPFWSETATEVADLIIPDVTYLERLAINNMPSLEQIPFVQLYQPVVEPLYESSSMYENYFEIAKRVGGETASYFTPFKDLEDFQKQAIEGEWGEGSWETLKRDGVLIPTIEGQSYKSFDQLTEEELKGMRKYLGYAGEMKPEKIAELKEKGAKFPSGNGVIKDDKDKYAGYVKNGKYINGFATEDGKFVIYSKEWEEHGFPALPDWVPVSTHKDKTDEDMYLITGKWNVHTHSRTANIPWLLEIISYNPVWMNPKTAEEKGISDGDEIIIESGKGAKELKCRVRVLEGIHPECVFVSNSFGHWEYGDLASKGIVDDDGEKRSLFDSGKSFPGENLEKGYSRRTSQQGRVFPFAINNASPVNVGGFTNEKADPITKNWEGKKVLGYHAASIMEASRKYTDPIGGEAAWSDTLVKVRKA